MKICFYGNGIGFISGNATLVRLLGKVLVKHGHEVTVATRSREEGVKIVDGIRYVPIFVEKKENLFSYYLEFPLRSLAYFLFNNDYDVIHTLASYHSFAILSRAVGFVARKPIIYSILSPAPSFLKLLRFDKLISTSLNIANSFPDADYIPPFVDMESFKQKPIQSNSNDKHPFIIGTMGTPLARRGIDVLVRSIPTVLKRFPNTLFILAIDLPQTKYEPRLAKGMAIIRKLIEDLDIPKENIKIVGEIDVPAFFASLDIFVYPVQTTSGMLDIPPTILDCLAAECALISTPLGGIPEVVKNYENGILVSNERYSDPTAYAEKIIELIETKSLWMKIKSNARKSIEEYDINRVAPKIIELYQSIYLQKN